MYSIAKVESNKIPWHELGYDMATSKHPSIGRRAFSTENAPLLLPKCDFGYIIGTYLGAVKFTLTRTLTKLSNTIRTFRVPILCIEIGSAANGISRLYAVNVNQSTIQSTKLGKLREKTWAVSRSAQHGASVVLSVKRCTRTVRTITMKSNDYSVNQQKIYKETAT